MIRCPKCGEKFRVQDGQAEGEWAETISLLPEFGRQGRLVFEYVELFSVVPLRGKGKKVLRLLKEMARLFGSEKFDFQKKGYRISKAGIVEALTVVCNKQFSACLENHNYLKKVMIGISEREQKERRDRADRDQKKREEVVGRVGSKQYAVGREEEVITADEFKKKRGIESLAGKIGKNIE